MTLRTFLTTKIFLSQPLKLWTLLFLKNQANESDKNWAVWGKHFHNHRGWIKNNFLLCKKLFGCINHHKLLNEYVLQPKSFLHSKKLFLFISINDGEFINYYTSVIDSEDSKKSGCQK